MARTSRSAHRVLWLELLLVGSLAAVALTLTQAYRASSTNRGVTESALRDYAGFAAWSYREHLMARIREALDEVLGPVNHGDGLHLSRGIPDAADLGHYLSWDNDCKCHRPRHGPLPMNYLGFTLGADTLGVATNRAAPGTKGWLVDMPSGPMDRPPAARHASADAKWVNELLTEKARNAPRSTWGYRLLVTRHDARTRVFAMRLMPTSWGDTAIYGVEYAAAVVDSALGDILSTSDLLPPTLAAANADSSVIELEVSDASGVVLFASRPDLQWGQYAGSTLPESFGGLRVRAQISPRFAERLIIGGTPSSRVPLLLVLLALSIGLTVLAAVLLRREVRFAAERAEFVANVSHELRTPLTQVRLVLDTLRLGREGDAAARSAALQVADREVLRLQHLVDGLLRFTRGRGRNDVPSALTEILAAARAVVEDFRPLAAPRGVAIAVAGTPVTVRLQQGALSQLLLNLLDNAVKYGPENSTISIEVQPLDPGGARISVSDAGPGIASADRERIWRPYERGSAAKQHAAGGSGIGLTIVRQIAEEHGGRAWVEDAPGGGARFVIELPAEWS